MSAQSSMLKPVRVAPCWMTRGASGFVTMRTCAGGAGSERPRRHCHGPAPTGPAGGPGGAAPAPRGACRGGWGCEAPGIWSPWGGHSSCRVGAVPARGFPLSRSHDGVRGTAVALSRGQERPLCTPPATAPRRGNLRRRTGRRHRCMLHQPGVVDVVQRRRAVMRGPGNADRIRHGAGHERA